MKIIIKACVLFSLMIVLLSANEKLPFVGKKSFNFAGGSGTGQTIEINDNGFTLIQLHGKAKSSVLYKGAYQKSMPISADTEYVVEGNEICEANPMEYVCTKMYDLGKVVQNDMSAKKREMLNFILGEEIECKNGNAERCYFVGNLYLHGADNLDPSPAKGKEFLQMACKLGYSKGCALTENKPVSKSVTEKKASNISSVANAPALSLKSSVSFGKVNAHMIELSSNEFSDEKCEFGYSLDDNLYFFNKVNSKCVNLTNSKGVEIICTPKKKMCKTREEVKHFLSNYNFDNNGHIAQKESSDKYFKDGLAAKNSGDYKKAMELFKKAADLGSLTAQFNLAVMHHNGEGVTADDKKAAAFLQKAADQGHVESLYFLGMMYQNGQGVIQDDKKAAEFYQKAADQGHVESLYYLAEMYYNGQGVTQDNKKAAEYYQKVADQGNAEAQYKLGVMYSTGRGVKQDDKKAEEFLQKAADQGNTAAKIFLKVKMFQKEASEENQDNAITGAFGLKLGETFNNQTIIGTRTTNSGETLYEIKPSKPIKYFKKYYVLATPKSHKIREIWGTSEYDSYWTCVKDLGVLESILKKKYGEFSAPILSANDNKYLNDSTNPDRGLSLKCRMELGSAAATFYIQYVDKKLNNLANKELGELEALKIDSSTL